MTIEDAWKAGRERARQARDQIEAELFELMEDNKEFTLEHKYMFYRGVASELSYE